MSFNQYECNWESKREKSTTKLLSNNLYINHNDCMTLSISEYWIKKDNWNENESWSRIKKIKDWCQNLIRTRMHT